MSTKSAHTASKLNAAWVAHSFSIAAVYDNFHIGLPFPSCVETRYNEIDALRMQGGGDQQVISQLKDFISREIPRRQFTYTDQWKGVLNHPYIRSLLQAIKDSGALCILICDDHIIEESEKATLPSWVLSLLSIPLTGHRVTRHAFNSKGDSGGHHLLFKLQESMLKLAKAASGNFVFLFASEFSSALIPMMTEANKANFYIDIGREGALKVFGITDLTENDNSGFQTQTAGGQNCTESRWDILERVHGFNYVYAQCPSSED